MSLRCETCQLMVNSQEQYQQHLTGKQHARRIQTQFPGQQVPSVLGNMGTGGGPGGPNNQPKFMKGHINFVQSGFGQQQMGGPGTMETGNGIQPYGGPGQGRKMDGGSPSLYCSVCMVTLNSEDQAAAHYNSNKHSRRSQILERHTGPAPPNAPSAVNKGDLYCTYCNIEVNSVQQMTVHRSGSKHNKMVEQRKRKVGGENDFQPTPKRPAMDAGHPVF